MLRKIYTFIQKETVLSISMILAVFSMFWIRPDHVYVSYIDFRTLCLLFCLMTIVAGLKEIGVFDFLAEKMLSKARGTTAVIALLVLLCFFFSMLITNYSALIIGTNIGGLGTLIASMASLISFKYIAKDHPHLRGKYFILFTVANILFLILLLLMMILIL